MKKKILACVTAGMLGVGMLSAGVYAATDVAENNGLKVSIETDKDSYANGDVLNLSVAITNDSTYSFRDVSYAIDVPEGITVAEGVKLSGNYTAIAAGFTTKLNVASEPLAGFEKPSDGSGSGLDGQGGSVEGENKGDADAAAPETTPKTGDLSPVAAFLVLAGIAMILFAATYGRKKRQNGALLLAFCVGATSLSVIPAQAAVPVNENFSVTAVKTITIEGVAKDITVKVTVGTEKITTIGIHDPSIFYDPVSGSYYSYGSHIIAGKSDDLISWKYIANSSAGYGTSNKLFAHHYLEEFAEVYEWLGADVKEGIWALDVTYSEAAAKAGKDPYFMYVTVTDAGRDALCLATSASPEGPFAYQGVLVCSDFRESEVENSVVNLLDVLGADSLSDLTQEQRDYYITDNRTDYRAKFPQCIDAAPYYDGDGNMYLAYGSFSSVGALHVLKLDPLTGLRAKDNYTYNPEELQDPYYGRQISVKRGEGPYVLTVPSKQSSTGYYYFLFWSQGTLSATGGYNMRMLRSEYPDRGFVDYAGKSAMDSSVTGVRIMDNFMFTSMKYSSTANGGNSAIVTKDGKMFLHYHSKSAHTAAYGENGFIIKSNQMFLNEDGWLVTTPFSYGGETMSELSVADVAGDYEFIYHTLTSKVHPAKLEDNYISSECIHLNSDGTVTGDYNGSWSMKGNYLTLTIAGKEYKGVVLKQYDEGTDRTETVVFTAEGTDNRTVWGSKIYYADEKRTQIDSDNLTVAETATDDFALDTTGRLGSKVTWTSDNSAIVVKDGLADVIRQDYDQTVTLTASIAFGGKTTTKEFKVTVPAEEIKLPSTLSTPVVTLPSMTEAGKAITWTSSNPDVINPETGKVVIPENSSVKVTLTGKIAGSDKVITKEITVMPMPSQVVYSENYDALESIDASLEAGLWFSQNAAAAVTLVADKASGKYVQFAPGRANSRGAISTFPADGQKNGIYLLEFDLKLTAGDNQTSEFAVTTENMTYLSKNINNGIETGYLFKLSATNSTTWAVNDGETFELPKDTWVHVSVLADTESENASLTITGADQAELYSGMLATKGAGTLKGFYVRGGRYNSVTAVDNITIKK